MFLSRLKPRARKILIAIRNFLFKVFIYNWCFFFKEAGMRLAQNPNKDLWGKVSFWMFPVYLNLAWADKFIIPWMRKKKIHLAGQAGILATGIYIFEFVFGVFYKYVLHVYPWDYSTHNIAGFPVHILGQVSLFFAPIWYLVGFYILWLYPIMEYITTYERKGTCYFQL